MKPGALSAFSALPLLLPSPPALAAAAATAEPAESSSALDQPALFGPDDLVLLEVISGGATLTDALGGYSARAGVYLPLGELARLLDLAIVILPPERRATGWVLAEERPFSIDLANGTARSGSAELNLSATDAVLHDDEIYVRAEILSKLIPAEFKADVRSLQLIIEPRETFPFQARLAREQRAGTIGADQSEAAGVPVPQPYRLFTPPALDVALDGALGNHAPRTRTRYDFRLAGDLLYTSTQFYLGSDDRGDPNNARILFERKDPDGRLAGPLGITRSSLGDTFTPGLSLGVGSEGGRGFAVGSEPLDQASVFNRIDLRGELPLGYQVELYVNEVLRGSQTQPVDGRYEFREVPLVYGINVIRLIFYGPRGERREEVKRINVGGGQLAPGEITFALGAVQQGRAVIPLEDRLPGLSLVEPGRGKLRAVGRAAYGLTSGITLVGGVAAYTPRLGSDRLVGTFGARTSVAGFASQLDLARDNRGGGALALGLAGRPLGVSIVARHSEYRGGFIDEALPRGGDGMITLRRSSDIRADASLSLGTRAIPIALQLQRDEQTNGRTTTLGTGRLSFAIDRYLLSNALSVQRESGGGAPTVTRITGVTDLSALLATSWQLRASVNYDVEPRLKVRQALATVDRLISDAISARVAVAHSFGRSSTTSIQTGVTVRFPWADLAATAGYETRARDYRVGLQLAFGMLFDPVGRRYRLARPGVASGGNVAVRAFADRDGDGRFGDGDDPLAGVKLRSGGRPVETAKDGTAIVTGLGDGTRARIEIDPGSLDDPYLSGGKAVYSLLSRPGRVAAIDLPFAPTGEVTLRLLFDEGERKRGLSALGVQLIAADGSIAATGRTEYDGALLVEKLKPGRYRIRLDPGQAGRLHLILGDTHEVVIPPGGGYVGEVEAIVHLPASG